MDLQTYTTPGSKVTYLSPDCWRLEIPPGEGGSYRWAQLDDYQKLPRKKFLWEPPVTIKLSARVSQNHHSGTWGFGFWNDPFNMSLGLGGTSRRLPAFPNTAWFFFASSENYLSIQDHLPANGMLAVTFSSPTISPLLFAPASLALPLAFTRSTARLMRKLLRFFIKEDSISMQGDWTVLHDFELIWEPQRVCFCLDGKRCMETQVAPKGKLGAVIWIDNQFACFPPSGALKTGTLQTVTPGWLEVKNVSIQAITQSGSL